MENRALSYQIQETQGRNANIWVWIMFSSLTNLITFAKFKDDIVKRIVDHYCFDKIKIKLNIYPL